MLCRQHAQAWCEQDDFTGKDAELALTTLLGTCAAWVSNDADDVSTLNVLVLLLEGSVGLGLLQLAHDLNGHTFSLAYNKSATIKSSMFEVRTNVEVQRIGGGPLCHDAETNANLLFRLRLALLEMRKVAYIVCDPVVDVELVWVRVRFLGGPERIDLVGADLEILLGHVSDFLSQWQHN
jgi:hypothetical protein